MYPLLELLCWLYAPDVIAILACSLFKQDQQIRNYATATVKLLNKENNVSLLIGRLSLFRMGLYPISVVHLYVATYHPPEFGNW